MPKRFKGFFILAAVILTIAWQGRLLNVTREIEAQTVIVTPQGQLSSYGEKETSGRDVNLQKALAIKKHLPVPGPKEKVTDPAKRVQDEQTRKVLLEQGIDPDYVELVQDYARPLTPAQKSAKDADPLTKYLPDPSPYSRAYRDRISGKYVLETQGLPRVDGDGARIVPQWKLEASTYKGKNNLFYAGAAGNKIEIKVKNTQPDGRLKGDKVVFSPRVFLDSLEQAASGPALLAIDPVNVNYSDNTLEWSYGVAKNRLRLIQGSVLGSWVFEQNPGKSVKIVYNQSGDYRIKLGKYALGDDAQFIPLSVFNSAEYPFTVSYAVSFTYGRIKVDAAKQPQDAQTRKLLLEQRVDPEYVELVCDYGARGKTINASSGRTHQLVKVESSPFARTYRDLNSDKFFYETQGLPMVDKDGVAVEPQWLANGPNFKEKSNVFSVDVERDGKARFTMKNDQPDGRKAADKLSFKPGIFLNGQEQAVPNPTLLANDPLNENYKNNTLEWDYGFVKRRARLIEGKFLGSWVFTQNPGGDVRIKYNQVGDFRLKLGIYAIDSDTEFIPVSIFTSAIYPFTVDDSYVWYPDANAEYTSVDGYVVHAQVGLSWSTLVAALGTGKDDSTANLQFVEFQADTTTNTWQKLRRGIFLFDTSGLPDTATISAATLSIYGSGKLDNLSATPNINIYTSAPVSSTALAAGDFDSLGSTAQSSAITYAGWSTSGYNAFTLNDMAQISLTSRSKFGARNANYDVAASEPSWVSGSESYLSAYMAEQGLGYKPKLLVTYTQSSPTTYWPDQNPETTSVDGVVDHAVTTAGTAWATLIAAAGSYGDETGTNSRVLIYSGTTTDQWYELDRLIFLFDSSGLPDTAVISAATLSLRGVGKGDMTTAITPDINIYSSAPASNINLAAGDFDSLGTTAFSTAKSYASFSTSAYNSFTLNSDGRNAISATGATKLGARNANYDVAATAPTWSSYNYAQFQLWMAENGDAYLPKLVVTYYAFDALQLSGD